MRRVSLHFYGILLCRAYCRVNVLQRAYLLMSFIQVVMSVSTSGEMVSSIC